MTPHATHTAAMHVTACPSCDAEYRLSRGRRSARTRLAPVLAYLGAIVAANLSVAAFGPSVTVVNAFLLIGFDLTLRDRLHDAWHGRNLAPKMALLIATGGAISYVLNRDAGQIALASTVAFVVAGALDAAVYALLGGRTRLLRVNSSNVVGAAADSLIFPTLAFGGLLWPVVIGQFVAKVAGGFIWSVVLAVSLRRQAG